MSHFKISIIDNDPKGKYGGTCYFINAEFGTTKESFTYSIMDEYRNTDIYQHYCSLWFSYQTFLRNRENELLEASKDQKAAQMKKRLAENKLSDTDKSLIKHILLTNSILVTDYEKTKGVKQLNALVGCCLGQSKMHGHTPADPAAIKHFLLEFLS